MREGQLKHLPQFASDLQKISDYDHQIIADTEKRAAQDPALMEHMDILAKHQYEGRSYDQLYPREKRVIVSEVTKQSGTLQHLLNLVRNAAKSGTHVNFGR